MGWDSGLPLELKGDPSCSEPDPDPLNPSTPPPFTLHLAPSALPRERVRAWVESRLSPGRRMNASGGRRTTDSRTERGAGVALAASWRPHSKRGHSEASFPGPGMAALTPLMPTATSETSSPKDRPTTKDLIISPEVAA